MSKYQDYREVARNEALVRRRLEAGWNAFDKNEVEGLLEALDHARNATRRYKHRLNMSHFTPLAWHFEGDIGLHERRPAPVGAINLFEKPASLEFEPGWRIRIPFRVPGYTIQKDGTLTMNRSRMAKRPISPNDVIRHCVSTLEALRTVYIIQNKQDGTPEV